MAVVKVEALEWNIDGWVQIDPNIVDRQIVAIYSRVQVYKCLYS